MNDSITNNLTNHLSQYRDLKFSIIVSDWQTDFLRFYQSQTNYNISKKVHSIDVTLYKDQKSYNFGIDQPTEESVKKAVNHAMDVIDSLPADPDFVDVETDLSKSNENQKENNVVKVSLEKKIEILKEIDKIATQLGFELFGTFICNYQHTHIINSNGVDKQQWNSPIYFEVKAVSKTNQVTVLNTYGGEDFNTFNLSNFINELKLKMINAQNDIVDVAPGEYDVILSPRCIAEFMVYLSGGMFSRSYDQKSSYFQDKINEQVFPDSVSIIDDPTDKEIISFDYNGDGHIYRQLPLIENGVFKNFMCNQYYSHKTGLPKNGNTGACLVLRAGNTSIESMISSIDKGLYISSLHYMNFINEKETSVTGLTRDGTFLIENGKITKVVNNLRFTEFISRIFQHITMLEDKSYTIPFSDNYEMFDISSAKAPHVLVKGFNITSSTKTI
jgi:predicted Zn-dependent protease